MQVFESGEFIMLLGQADSRVEIECGPYTPEAYRPKDKTANSNIITTQVARH